MAGGAPQGAFRAPKSLRISMAWPTILAGAETRGRNLTCLRQEPRHLDGKCSSERGSRRGDSSNHGVAISVCFYSPLWWENGCSSEFHGWPDTWKDAMDNLIHIAAPAVAIWVLLFIWHLWLAPSALVYEALKEAQSFAKGPPLPAEVLKREKPINWAIWKQRPTFTLKEFANILARAEPTSNLGTEATAFVRLIGDDIAQKVLACQFTQTKYSGYTMGNFPPAQYPHMYKLQKEAAIKWAKSKNFDVSSIK